MGIIFFLFGIYDSYLKEKIKKIQWIQEKFNTVIYDINDM